MIAEFKKNKRGGFRKDIFFSAVLGILLLFVIGFLIFTNLKISQRRQKLISRVGALEKEIQILEEKNEKLKENISQAGSKEYLEQVAREQLGFKKPGEEAVVIIKEEGEEKKEEGGGEENKSWWERLKFWEW